MKTIRFYKKKVGYKRSSFTRKNGNPEGKTGRHGGVRVHCFVSGYVADCVQALLSILNHACKLSRAWSIVHDMHCIA